MKNIFFIGLLLLILSNTTIAQQENNKNSMLSNWTTSQIGEFTGWFATGLTFRTLEGINVIRFDSNEQRTKVGILTGVVVGGLSCNFLLKLQTKQNTTAFIKTTIFSFIPVLAYSLMVRPDFKGEGVFLTTFGDELGLIATSMFLTPLFSVIGNEMFNTKRKAANYSIYYNITPRMSVRDKAYQINIALNF